MLLIGEQKVRLGGPRCHGSNGAQLGGSPSLYLPRGNAIVLAFQFGPRIVPKMTIFIEREDSAHSFLTVAEKSLQLSNIVYSSLHSLFYLVMIMHMILFLNPQLFDREFESSRNDD